MIVDCHVHTKRSETAADILQAMDDAGIDIIFPFSYEYITDPKELWPELERLSKICREAPDRLYPFALIDPRFPDAPETLERAVAELGYRGLKMLPNHWYPYDDVAMKMYEKMQELGVPGIFHSGILYGQIYTDSSRFCRPVYYEALVHYPEVQFGLAHMGWPWCEECVSLFGRFRNFQQQGGHAKQQMFIDLTPGGWNVAEMEYALERAGAAHIIYGSDANTGSPEGLAFLKSSMEKHRRLFDELNVSAADQNAIFGETVMSWFE